MATLAELESHLQSLLEVHLLKYLPGYKIEDGIVEQLAVAMRGNLKETSGTTLAPNLYVVVANPSTLDRWRSNPPLFKELAEALFTAGQEAGLKFPTKPLVTSTADKNMSADEIHIIASFTNESLSETHSAPLDEESESNAETTLNNAFFIFEGAQVFPISRSVVNIGRRLENHIVIDDPRVSRAHAQLRNVKDRYILFDLSSSGGTFVNGQRINQAYLSPGDIVSLAGVTLIFGQDLPQDSTSDEEKTGPGFPTAEDLAIKAIKKKGKGSQ